MQHRRAACLALALFSCTFSQAYPDTLAAPRWTRAVVQVYAGKNGGSGILFSASPGYVCTNSHVVGRAARATVIWQDQQRRTGKVVWRDRLADLAVVQVDAPRGAVSVELATRDQAPRQGDTVHLAGYGIGGTHAGLNRPLTVWPAIVEGYVQDNTGRGRTQLQIATGAISGDSGGGIIFNGRLCACLWGFTTSNGNKHTRGTVAEYLRKNFKGCAPNR